MSEDTYTHRPGKVDEDRENAESEPADYDELVDSEAVDSRAPVERGREEFRWRDWLLVGAIVVCFLVIPATIIYLPPVRPFRFAYLVLPLVPAFVLGAIAVWSAQRTV